jgi:nicotinamidase-related amidase
VVDVFNDFDHEDGANLLASFRDRAEAMRRTIDAARAADVPIVYANDERGRWTSDAPRLVRDARHADAGDLLEPLLPHADEAVVLKHRYSAFDHTALELLLEALDIRRVVLVGAATEGCVVQTAIDAREHGLRASIVADACATTDPELEAIALRYATLVGGIRVEYAGATEGGVRCPGGVAEK